MFKKIQQFLMSQLKQGVTPHGVALACAVGLTGCLLPMLGVTTLMCFGTAHFLKLNHPIVQTVNYAAAPLQFLMFPVFLKLGAFIFREPAVSLNPAKAYQEFMFSPSIFMTEYGAAWLQSMVAWLVCAPFVLFIVYKLVRLVFARTASRNIK